MPVEEFSLPTTLTVLTGKITESKHVAHCLDFDLIEAAPTEEEASSRLRLTIRTYVEFGLSKGWSSSVRHRAPQRFWDLLTPDVPVKFMPPIKLANVTAPVIKVEEPCYEALASAG